MTMGTPATETTAIELSTMPDDGFRYELVRGELRRMPPAGSEHGVVAMNFGTLLNVYVKANALGVVFGAETGFKIAANPDTVRAPDVAFVQREHVPVTGIPREFWPGAPDLVAEVISPSDTYADVEEKVKEWLDAGVRMAIVLNPRSRTVAVYLSYTEVRRLTEADILTGGEVVPGFACRVSELFI
jgi:Uma2 family endonuclease